MSKPNPITFEKLLKILLMIFACLTIISALTIYYTHQLPTQETQTTTLCTYIHKGTYRYVAELKPNLIYNKTTLTPEDNATLYTTIVKYINLTFTYTFNINPQPENILIEHQITFQIESPGKWPSRTLKPEEAQEMLQLSGNLNWTMQVNITRIRQFVEAIDKEIFGATRSTTYNININPKIHVEANITTQNTIKKLDETFTPKLTIAFKTDAEKGNYVAIENLNQTKPGKITETQQIPIPQVQTQRTASLTATAITASALTASAILYMFKKPPTPPEKATEKQLKKLIDPYKELIAKTTQKPPETENTIEMETLEDLAKIAEILARPILHTTEAQEHTFYIIDNNTKYQYKTII
jgi:flagellar basal body-associated protein FliL